MKRAFGQGGGRLSMARISRVLLLGITVLALDSFEPFVACAHGAEAGGPPPLGSPAALVVPSDATPPSDPNESAASALPESDFNDLAGLLAEPIVSTASEAAQLASAAPGTSRSLSADELRRYGIRSLDEAINYLSLGMVTQNPLHSVDVGARGVVLTADFGNHVLLLVNGHTMNEPWDGTAYFERGAAIPFELIDHIEIILGPGSVLYGSNAMLGVINVITKRSEAWKGLHVVAESELITSGRVAVGGAYEFSLLGHPASLVGQLEYFRQTGPTFVFGPQSYGNDAVTGLPKKFDPAGMGAGVWGGAANRSYWSEIPSAFVTLSSGRFDLDLRAASYKRGTPAVNGFNQTLGDFNEPANWERDRWLSLDGRHHLALSRTWDLTSHVYGDLYQYLQPLRSSAPEDCQPGQDQGCIHETVGRSRWAGLEERVSADWAHDGRWTTMMGVDGRVRHTGQSLHVIAVDTGVDGRHEELGRTESTLGVYVQQMAHPLSRLDLNLGLRLDADPRFGRHSSPRAALVVTPWEGGTLKGIYAEAFRAPTLYEHAYSDPISQIAAPNLRPEVVRSVEAVFEQRLGRQRFLLGAFRSWWRDMVSLQTLTPDEVAAAQVQGALLPSATTASQYQNVAGIDNIGMDAAFDGANATSTLRYGGSATVASAQRKAVDGSTVDLAVTPKIFGNVRVSYDLPGRAPVVGLAAAFFGRRLADRANDGGFDPLPTVPASIDLRATVSGEVPWFPGLSYRLTANVSSGSRSPYVVGPLQAATPAQPRAELSPVDRFRLGFGLQYDFGSSP